MITIVGLCFTGNGDHSPENRIHHNTQNTLWGNKPMIVQLSCHTIKSTTAQTFENAENAEISQGLYVAALKNCTRERGQLPLSPVHSGALKSAHRLSPPNLGPWILIAQPLFDVLQ